MPASSNSKANWSNYIEEFRDFADYRPAKIREQMCNNFSLVSNDGFSRRGRAYSAGSVGYSLGGRVASEELEIEAERNRSATTVANG